jgi:acyl-CoA thioester hydrolase
MESYIKKVEIRWADLDPNFHVLHSKYYDFGASSRMSFLTENGITIPLLQQYHIGPILLREECLFKKEIKFGDEITISLMLDKISKDQRKWTMQHEIWKNGEKLAALITIDGAWLDTVHRRITTPPPTFMPCFNAMPRTTSFSITG